MIRLLLFLGFILDSAVILQAQDLQFNTINYTIEDGLPSNECHDILQDSLGYIWIATDRGLVRFDGYTFKTYGVPEGLTDVSCLDMVFDQEENIWIHTFSGKIFIYHQATDRLSLYPHQAVVDSFLNKAVLRDLEISNENELIIAFNSIGFLIVNNETGSFELKRSHNQDSKEILFIYTVNDNILISRDTRDAQFQDVECTEIISSLNKDFYYCQYYIDYKEYRYKGDYGNLRSLIPYKPAEAFLLRDSFVLMQIMGTNYFFDAETLLFYQTNQLSCLDIIPYSDEAYLAGLHYNKGLHYYADVKALEKNQSDVIINDVSISKILQDRERNLWCTSLEKGLFYLKKEEIKPLSTPPLGQSNVKDIETENPTLYFLEGKNSLYSLKNQVLNQLRNTVYELKSIRYSENYQGLFLCGDKTEFIKIDDSSKSLEYLSYNNESIVLPSKNSFEFELDELFFSTSSHLMLLEDIDSTQSYHSLYDELNLRMRILAVEKVSDDFFLLGTAKGLKRYGHKAITELEDYPIELQLRINAIQKLGKWYVFGTQGNGLVFWDLQDTVFSVQRQDGILSNNIEKLFLDKDNKFYVSTKSGLSKVWLDENQTIQIKNYTTFHGLPSNEVNDIDQMGDTIYIATSKGIATLVDEPIPAILHQPFFTSIQVNDSTYNYDVLPSQLKHQENNLFIRFKTIDHKMQGKIPYRYRLNESDWIETYATQVNYPTLASGAYTFQVQSKNIDDQWSETIQLEFTIRKPWWQQRWFLVGSLWIISSFAYFVYRSRTNRLKQKLATEREIRDLERSALQAQMNPHFIFNCLNSIQNFIILNDKENAMEYLTKFAQLIRQTLRASTQNKIALDQELHMLRNYLELEKLRFKNKFEYNIDVTSDIDPITTQIPTMLIQPFVENAIIHGMGELKSGGQIAINISKQATDMLFVQIKDNGTGKSGVQSAEKRKSFGMSITGKRLALNNRIKDDAFKITPSYTPEGTEVGITIKL